MGYAPGASCGRAPAPLPPCCCPTYPTPIPIPEDLVDKDCYTQSACSGSFCMPFGYGYAMWGYPYWWPT
jgi:hypothetical protein